MTHSPVLRTAVGTPVAPAAAGADTGPVHHEPQNASDRFALATTRLMRWMADLFFAQRYGHRAVVLETVAAVPGMVGATATHLQSLRRMADDDGWIRTQSTELKPHPLYTAEGCGLT